MNADAARIAQISPESIDVDLRQVTYALYGTSRRLMARAGRRVLLNDRSGCNKHEQDLENAARVSSPALQLSGRQGMTLPKALQNLAKALPDVRMQVLDGAGHVSHDGRATRCGP